MKGLEFLEKINDIDSDLLEASENGVVKKNNFNFKWMSIAASILLIASLSIVFSRITKNKEKDTSAVFAYQGVNYEVAVASDLEAYGLTPVARSAEDGFEVPKEECGELLGEVELLMDDKKIKCKAYSLASYNDDLRIIVVALPKERYVAYVHREDD